MQKVGLLVAVFFLTAMIACAEKQKPKTPPDKVTVQLKWVHQAQFAGFYVAKAKGYYTAENLSVNFLEGGQGIDDVQALISGQADFAVVAPEDIFIQRSKGTPIKAIAVIYQRSAVVYISMVGSGIVRPSDFSGRTIATTGVGGAVRDMALQFHALVNKLGLNRSTIRLVPYDPNYEDFISGRVDVSAAYSTGGVVKLLQGGYRLNIIWPGDYGVHFYSDTIATSEQLIAEKTELVERFLRATLKGWRTAVGDPESAVNITLQNARVQDKELQMTMMEALLPLVYNGEDPIGWMNGERWQDMHRILLEQRILPAALPDPSQVYTSRFVKAIYEGGTR